MGDVVRGQHHGQLRVFQGAERAHFCRRRPVLRDPEARRDIGTPLPAAGADVRRERRDPRAGPREATLPEPQPGGPPGEDRRASVQRDRRRRVAGQRIRRLVRQLRDRAVPRASSPPAQQGAAGDRRRRRAGTERDDAHGRGGTGPRGHARAPQAPPRTEGQLLPRDRRLRARVLEQAQALSRARGHRAAVDRPRGRLHRDHEHHARRGRRAHAGDRHSQGARRQATGHPRAVPHRVGDAQHRRRRVRRPARHRNRRADPVLVERRCRRASRPGRWRSASCSARVSGSSPAYIPRAGPRCSIPSSPCAGSNAPCRRSPAACSTCSEGMRIALDAMLAPTRCAASLTILSVAVGVFVVVVISAAIHGINQSVAHDFESAGPTTFFLQRYPIVFENCDGSDDTCKWRSNPPLTFAELAAIQRLDGVDQAGAEQGWNAPARYRDVLLPSVSIDAFSGNWATLNAPEMIEGRAFTDPEARSAARVVVLNTVAKERLLRRQRSARQVRPAERNSIRSDRRLQGQRELSLRRKRSSKGRDADSGAPPAPQRHGAVDGDRGEAA